MKILDGPPGSHQGIIRTAGGLSRNLTGTPRHTLLCLFGEALPDIVEAQNSIVLLKLQEDLKRYLRAINQRDVLIPVIAIILRL